MDMITQLQRQFVDYTTSLYRDGYLYDQFTQLQKLQDESNPDFVVDVVSIFFDDSEKLLNNLATALQQQTVDYKQVDAHVHQFKDRRSKILMKEASLTTCMQPCSRVVPRLGLKHRVVPE